MKKLFFLYYLFLLPSIVFGQAAVVVKAKGTKALIKLGSTKVSPGKVLVAADSNLKLKAILRVVKVKGNAAIVIVVKGKALKGSKIYTKKKFLRLRKNQTSGAGSDDEEEEQDEEGTAPEEEDFATENNRGKKKKKTTASKSFYARANPLGVATGFFGADAGFTFWKTYTIGISYLSLSATINDVDIAGTAIGLRGEKYFSDKPAFTANAWYVSFVAGTLGLDLTATAATGESVTVSVSGSYFGAMAGYLWAWDTMHIGAGAGINNYSIDSQVETTLGTIDVPLSGAAPVGELTIGISF